MRKRMKKNLLISLCLLMAFAVWTAIIRHVDVQSIGPEGSAVGFAAMNGGFHHLTGVHWGLYTLTDWLGLVPLCVALGFAVLGLGQWVSRRSLLRVDGDILLLGGFYVLVMAAYVGFEMVPINYRPVLIDGYLEASYPSSTTLLVLCVMPTTMMQINSRIYHRGLKCILSVGIVAFIAFMVIGRLVSGVHWLTDIIGGMLLSAGLVMLYHSVCGMLK